MPFPPTVPSGADRANTTPQVNLHPADHNEIHAALSDIINELGANPSGTFDDLTARLATLAAVEPAVSVPAGAILPFAGSVAPTDWGFCTGAAVSRSEYSELFAAIGTTYGVGNGSTTFNLPNMQSRFPVGKGTENFSNVLGEVGGTKDAVVVSHSHGYSDEYRSVSNVVAAGSNYGYNPNLTSASKYTNSEGVSGTDKNLPPYIALNFIIRLS